MTHIHGHVLVVDDDPTNRLKLSIGLKQQGHTVIVAEDGRRALELLRTQPGVIVSEEGDPHRSLTTTHRGI